MSSMEKETYLNKLPSAVLADHMLIDHSECELCDEDYYFNFKDAEKSFQIGIKEILSCIAFAEEKGALPELPSDWWNQVCSRY